MKRSRGRRLRHAGPVRNALPRARWISGTRGRRNAARGAAVDRCPAGVEAGSFATDQGSELDQAPELDQGSEQRAVAAE